MEKESNAPSDNNHFDLERTGPGSDATSEALPLVNGVAVNISKPYRKSKKFSRYNNALKNLIPVRPNVESTGTMPIDSAGLYSTVFGGWLTKYLWKAYLNNGTTMSDLPTVSPYDRCDYNVQRLETMWNDEVVKHGVEEASFRRVAWRFVRTRILTSCLLLSIALLLGFLSPVLLMRKVLEFVQSPDGKLSEGIKWALLLGLCEFSRILFLTWSWINNYRTAMRLKNAYLGMLYKKIIRTNDFGNKSSGKLINMISNDGQRLFDVCLFGSTIIGGPIVTVCGIIYILWILSPMGLLGMLTFFFFYPVQYGISRLNGYFKSRGVKLTDQRISGVNEILDCVKLIKMYAWEESFRNHLFDVRRKEQIWLHKVAYARSVGLSLSPTIPVISVIVTFLAHVAGGNNLMASQAFPITMFFMNQMKLAQTSLREGLRLHFDCKIAFGRFKVFPLVTLFNTQIRHMFSFVEVSISNIIEATISCARFKSVLVMDDGRCNVEKPILKTQALSIVNGTFTCEAVKESPVKPSKTARKSKTKNDANDETRSESNDRLLSPTSQIILTDITFEAIKGKLIGICGHVGSGKTSLLHAALGQLRLSSGQIFRDGSCAYVSQQAWILHATVRENIIFGDSYDVKRYDKAVESCRLREDLDAFPAGDDTEIGERGINLSGGQKQRVALARALYANRDIYFLDDPLSAVDAQVGSYIFENLIRGALYGKTILFVTHQIQYLNRCDEIYMMSGGRIVERGIHEKLMEADNKYAGMVKSMMSEAERETNDGGNAGENDGNGAKINLTLKEPIVTAIVDDGTSVKKNPTNEGTSIMSPDNVETGTIKAQTYNAYVKAAGGYFVALLILLIFTLNVGSTAFSSWWLAHWIKAGAGSSVTVTTGNETLSSQTIIDNPDLGYYETVYATCIAAILITSALRGLAIARATIRASTSLHNRVFTKILRAPMEFFETTPRGRIQNIFSRDTDEIDVYLPISLEGVLQSGLGCIISLGFICAVFPWFIVALMLLGFLFYYIGKVFRVALRDLKRFESTTRSPIFSFATASVQGLDTIHAFEKENDFVKQFQAYLDSNGAYQYLCNIAMRWLAVRYDSLAGIATATTALFVVFLKGQVPPALAGLAMAYSGQMSGIFQFTMRMFSETELRFISVERINHYLRTLVNEDDGTKSTTKSLKDWPANGEIEFKNVELRYRKDLPTVLNKISFHIRANEKIGIVGRTGSGKSSIVVALFRIVELSGGSINIDDTDISEIHMKRLRANISIIPQDPVLFNRSVRFNLDPNGENSDTELWLVLEKTQLKNRIRAMAGQLGATIDNGGSNLSMGERQLLCLARALLRKNKILVLDEATAAVDPETEAIVQMTIQREFTDCTIITIAHRLATVLSCDRILVMDTGNIVEFDSPSKLLAENSNSRFSKMMIAANKAITGLH